MHQPDIFKAYKASIKPDPLVDNRYHATFNGAELLIEDTRSEAEIKSGAYISGSPKIIDINVPSANGGTFKIVSRGVSNFAPFLDAIVAHGEDDPRKIAIQERISRAQAELEEAQAELAAL